MLKKNDRKLRKPRKTRLSGFSLGVGATGFEPVTLCL